MPQESVDYFSLTYEPDRLKEIEFKSVRNLDLEVPAWVRVFLRPAKISLTVHMKEMSVEAGDGEFELEPAGRMPVRLEIAPVMRSVSNYLL